MMFKSLALFPLLFTSALGNQESSKNPAFNLEINERGNYTIVSVKSDYASNKEIKTYYDQECLIDEISDDAFVSCTNLQTLVLSYSITHISNNAFIDSIKTVKYTGSAEQYAQLGITKGFDNISYYSSDEGFINYWNLNIRPNADSNICNITNETFRTAYTLYCELTITERDIVNTSLDKAGEKIGSSMKVLINQFNVNPQPSNKGTTWNQKGALSFIIVVAVIGMTSICVFYLMKTKQIID